MFINSDRIDSRIRLNCELQIYSDKLNKIWIDFLFTLISFFFLNWVLSFKSLLTIKNKKYICKFSIFIIQMINIKLNLYFDFDFIDFI